jgi:hypothetical protein
MEKIINEIEDNLKLLKDELKKLKEDNEKLNEQNKILIEENEGYEAFIKKSVEEAMKEIEEDIKPSE